MITCTTCGFANPMGTRWCRQCGAKLNLDFQQITQAIAETAEATTDARLLERGRSLAFLGVFLLLAAVMLRWALVPAVPPAEPPIVLPPHLLPASPAALPAVPPPASGAIASARLRWRAVVCRPIGNRLGLDLAALDAAREEILSRQKSDHTWVGSDPLAATALATLALQAWPTPTSLAAAAASRSWLVSQLEDPTRRSGLGRILALCALSDADELGQGQRDRLQAYLIDGRFPQWQTWLLSGIPSAGQPLRLDLLRAAPVDDLWRWQLALATGTRPTIETNRFFTEAASGIAAVDRMSWVYLAWQLTPAPTETTKVLGAWSRAPAPNVGDELAPAGPDAARAVWLLALAAPCRLPALAAGTATP